MGGIDVGGGGGKRKSVDAEINMIPMIDLLMVTISFLLISAVWTHMARINADAMVPGPPRPDVETTPVEPERQLHVIMQIPPKQRGAGADQTAEPFKLLWKRGATTEESIEVPRKDVITKVAIKAGSEGSTAAEIVRFPDLADKIEEEWKKNGMHSQASDPKRDQAIVHANNDAEYGYIIAVIDALYKVQREMKVGDKSVQIPAFNVTFAVN